MENINILIAKELKIPVEKCYLNHDELIIQSVDLEEVNIYILQNNFNIQKLYIEESNIQSIVFSTNVTMRIDFVGCKFQNFHSQTISYKEKINIAHSVFYGNAYFSYAEFQQEVIFKNVVFEKKVTFASSEFKKYVEFDVVYFNGETNFDYSVFKSRVMFNETYFNAEQKSNRLDIITSNDNIETSFRGVVFEDKIDFQHSFFYSRVDFVKAKFKDELCFQKTKFLAENTYNNIEIKENFFTDTIFKKKVIFVNVIFKSSVYFRLLVFEDEVRFVNTIFHRNICSFDEIRFSRFSLINDKNYKTDISIDFTNSSFDGMVFFNNVNFVGMKFNNVIFNDNVNFNKTKLLNKPEFINCTFSNQFNIEHKHIEYNFSEIEKKQEYDKLLNYRDLFRKLKSNRIAHHNLIDASELRTQELYARELELKHKENKNLKDTIEQWQLFFYRKLCDHHTDLVLNAKWLIFTIALYILLIGKIWYIYPIALISFFIIDVFFKTKNTSIIISSIIIFITLCNQPKMILAIPNLLSNDFNWWQNLITSIYIIVFGLIIFSLQKTARKNTIIPN
ncbi:hypothetical protein L8V88_05540 [Campylobacter sp. IFREMER_LSEM_CL2101]|uniref:pentapeptide repeat-containing protein n=1 Tax=Campylobacter sp. IFREMER_LSEM_CL2101 TaxID=2911618 RepID=UPI0021E8AD87|nr:pentapeptide repeat-containing protein [Campylobacter sp. IFREMER_LSEM_CL2101]MCV3392485.1 hypothetical protein [Campylobacter sp. IFREMER_LSEM_CL2101]